MASDHTDHAPDEPLTAERLGDDPVAAFRGWLADAERTDAIEPTGVTLATVDAAGRPDARVVLLKDAGPEGFVFYSNYASRKGQELEVEPWACLNFWWPQLARQVRVRGPVEKLTPEESDAYFASRARGSQVGAWASQQSRAIPDRETLERRAREFEDRYPGDVPRPPHWGGLSLHPEEMEFWQGRADRLHDRIRYIRSGGSWDVERLAP